MMHELLAVQREALKQSRLSLPGDHRVEVEQRLGVLRSLQRQFKAQETDILQALHSDLGKSAAEGYATELALVYAELRHTIRHLKNWMAPRRTSASLAATPGRGRVQAEPYGHVLIISPWNYPFQLSMIPLIGALAAGNHCIVKPSQQSPETGKVMRDIVEKALPRELAAVVLGSREESDALLNERFDYIFFTGSPTIGKHVMERASHHLTPVTLELGGKSPCLVDETADIPLAARRIAFGKGINAGQTCIAPDYVLAHESIAHQLMEGIAQNWTQFYGADALANPQWPRIINQRHYQRLMGLLSGEAICHGGLGDGMRIQPTLLKDVTWDSPVMQEEIFGPLLPVITYQSLDEVLRRLAEMEKPLAFYFFSKDRSRIRRVLHATAFGGGCVNDCLMHVTSSELPFGGVGQSGMGRYHGKASFDTFSHHKSVLFKGGFDVPFRYPPYSQNKFTLLKRLLK